MIAYLTGSVEEINADGLILDRDGIGYEILLPQSRLDRISMGQKIKLHTYLQVREDGYSLFGFLDKKELDFFRLLISVNGVGPKLAIAILGAFSMDQLILAIAANDDKTLAKAPGVGKKTAQRIILDLKDKIDFVGTMEESLEPKESNRSEESMQSEAILALEALGYSPSEALGAIRAVDGSDQDLNGLIRLALRQLAPAERGER